MHSGAELLATETRFEDDLRDYIEKYASLWEGVSDATPAPHGTFSPQRQARNELETDRLIDSIEREFRSYPHTPSEQEDWRTRIFAALRKFGTDCFAFPDSHFDIIFSPEYFSVTKCFARQARAFDQSITPAALAQALRNVWVMNCLQIFLGRRPAITPSVFAYSMLYPYTDNYLDQPHLRQEVKKEVCHRLDLRLQGMPVEPSTAHESVVFRLIGMIDGEYPRDDFPEVHESLLAIHAGQIRSLTQQQGNNSPDETSILKISLEKGGSSVLADGWLVAGALDHKEADFFFGFGVMLQLLDDLQDLLDDRQAGHWTLFSRMAATGNLDRLTNRLWHFMNAVLEGANCLNATRQEELKALILRNSSLLLQRAVAQNVNFYSGDYLRRTERSCPLRFSYLRARHRSVGKRFRKIWPGLSQQRNLHSIFDLLG